MNSTFFSAQGRICRMDGLKYVERLRRADHKKRWSASRKLLSSAAQKLADRPDSHQVSSAEIDDAIGDQRRCRHHDRIVVTYCQLHGPGGCGCGECCAP